MGVLLRGFVGSREDSKAEASRHATHSELTGSDALCRNDASSDIFIKDAQHGFIGCVAEKQGSRCFRRYLQSLPLANVFLEGIAAILVERFFCTR